ncbi:MAG: TonB-dependent receptor [Bacteroidetes bacterium]|nr:TonB-dependent receptor [Bacteroidota bacterium]
MKKTKIIMAMLCLMGAVHAQVDAVKSTDTTDVESFDEVLVSSQRFQQRRKETPRQIEVVSAKRLSELQPATLGDALINTGQVFVQKSQMGGSSPVLRGFEASRVLMVIDGVRMNNATYRAGHLQDIITIDPFILDRMEVNFGSGSTLYGSDALGGVLYFKTKDAGLGEFAVKPSATLRYQSASNSLIGNAGLKIQSKKVGVVLSATRNQFGDLRSGSRNYSDWDTFGMLPRYVTQINGRDTVLMNEDPQLQKGTGYSQTDLFAKVFAKTGQVEHTLNVQRSMADLIPRYDRMSQFNNGKPVFGRWDYSPQNREYISYTAKVGSEDHHSRLTLAQQRTEVGRVTRNFGSLTERTQLDNVRMRTVNLDRHDQLGKSFVLNSGVELVWNEVNSVGINKNISTLAETATKARYSDSGAATQMHSVFAQGIYKMDETGTVIQGGVRVSKYTLEALFSGANPWKLPYQSISFVTTTPSYDLGLTQQLKKGLLLKASVPSPDLKAEQSRTVDLGVLWRKDKSFAFEAGVFRSAVKNLLLDQPGALNGEDSLMYDGRLTPVFQLKNVALGEISGLYLNAKVRLVQALWFSGSVTQTKGIYRLDEAAAEQPLDHIPPVYGQASLRWNGAGWFAEAQCLFNGMKKAQDYSSSGEDNQDKQPIGLADINGDGKADGFNPAWQCWNLRGGYQHKSGFSATVAIENVLDLHYRYFASGMSAAGRSVNVSLAYSF